MAEVTTPESPTPPATPAPAETTPLEKVYKDFNIEEAASQFQPQSPQPAPQQQPQQNQPQAPKFDPFDPNFPAHLERISKAATDAQSSLHTTQAQLSQLQQQLHHERVEADIKRAVGTLVEGTELKPRIAEVAMEAKAREDARFRAIWQNRAKNPAAFGAALKAFKQELQDEYTVRQDPQLVENQRAMKAAQQSMATTQKQSVQDEWAGMTVHERQAKIRTLINGGG